MKKMKLLIAGLLFCYMLPTYGYDKKDDQFMRLDVQWNSENTERSLTPIPISGKITNGLLILTNSQPDRIVHLEIRNAQGVSILTKEVLQENSAYIAIPLDALQDGEEYMLIITSSVEGDYLSTIF